MAYDENQACFLVPFSSRTTVRNNSKSAKAQFTKHEKEQVKHLKGINNTFE